MDISLIDKTKKTPGEETYAEKLLRTALDIAEGIIICGGAVHRAEETIERICKSNGATHVEVFSIPSMIIASIRMSDSEYVIQTRRIYSSNNNFNTLDRLNSVSRALCLNDITLDEAQEKIKEAKKAKSYPFWVSILASMIISGAFALFFGGTLLDMVASAVLGLVVCILTRYIPSAFNRLTKNFLLSFIVGCLANVFKLVGFCDNYDKIIIGTIMLLVPGIAFGTSMRDLLGDDTLSGTLQFIQSIVLAVVLAGGYIAAIYLMSGVIV